MTDRTPGDRPARPALPPEVTMPLLTLVSRQALDEDYVRAAQRRADPGQGKPPRRRYVAASAVLVLGALASTAAVQRSRDADVDDAGRATLISRITEEREQVARLQERVVDLRETNTRTAESLADAADAAEAVSNQVRRLRIATGFVATSGPGVEVSLTDPADAKPTQRVFDSDLALLVNALWSAGAEAIGINGQRLTAESAIRSSGRAIEINSVGVASPYLITAIGDRRSLQANFFDTSSGLAFADLAQKIGFSYDLKDKVEVAVPLGPERFLELTNVRLASGDPETNRGESAS